MAIRSYQEKTSDTQQVCLDELEDRLRGYKYPAEYLPTLKRIFWHALQEGDDPFALKLLANNDKTNDIDDYRDYVCRIICAESVTGESWRKLQKEFFVESEKTRKQHSDYLGSLFSIAQEITSTAQKKEKFNKQRIARDRYIYGLDFNEAKEAAQDINSPFSQYFIGDSPSNSVRNIKNHLVVIEMILRELADKVARYYYVYTPGRLSDKARTQLEKIADIDPTRKGVGLHFHPETNLTDLKNTLLDLQRILPVDQYNDLILNDIRRNFFLFKTLQNRISPVIDNPRAKTLYSLLKKMNHYEEKYGRKIYVGDIPDISGARISGADYFFLENLKNAIMCIYPEDMILEEENLYLHNPPKAYRDLKLLTLINKNGEAQSDNTYYENQGKPYDSSIFQNLEHILYKPNAIPEDLKEQMRHILLVPLLNLELKHLREYNRINKLYLKWIDDIQF
ncbi:MAG: hypothetical protein LBD99_02595 [Candidatus Margulisbacteria bacterium]|jgi:ppGpp synthetase/RelA/SpoT-type nucleotidyltranferase|nr:hypothetical protein [Candidatus Margulisiibacteriota bacterium]